MNLHQAETETARRCFGLLALLIVVSMLPSAAGTGLHAKHNGALVFALPAGVQGVYASVELPSYEEGNAAQRAVRLPVAAVVAGDAAVRTPRTLLGTLTRCVLPPPAA